MTDAIGPILIILALLAIPVVLMLIGAGIAAGLGWVLKRDSDEQYEGTEYLEIS
ncbi:MAG: hypothetical protein JJU45_19650 [Acidimicrobiia bacterium]|nr:hypothetical protein [Acidimicrobiia bacterium]